MGLLSKFKSSSATSGSGSTSDPVEVVRVARVSARRRLIGAALLLGVGIIGFPLLFETQPRPIPVDIPIDIPSREAVAPLVAVAPRSSTPARASDPTPASKPAPAVVQPVVEPKPDAPKPASRVEPPKPDAVKPNPKPDIPKPTAKPEPKPEAPKPAPKPAETKPAPKPSEPAAEAGRFVVQVGAYLEVQAARDARQKLEGMGYKTYTQVIESPTGRRIRVRVGPYPSKAEADKIAARIKAVGMQAAVLLL